MSGDWIQLISGKKFFPLAPRPEDIEIEDIAHATAMLCRYTGHVARFYCPTPEQRILTADLRWVPAGELKTGDELVGFDETPTCQGGAGKKRRRFRHSQVLAAVPVKRPVIRLEMEDGSTVRASSEHPWLVATKTSRNQVWRTAGEVAKALEAGRRRYMHRFVEPWCAEDSRWAGWLAGIYDGEGHLSFLNRGGVQMGVAQRPGLVLSEIEAASREFGFRDLRFSGVGRSDVISMQLLGGWREMARMLGTIRPIRLLEKFVSGLRSGKFDKQLDGRGGPLEITAAIDEGEQWVSGIETSSRTYLCEGFGAHNSVAEHSVRVARRVLDRTNDPTKTLWGLLHDASEAYLADMSRPVKYRPELAGYREAERRVQLAVCERFKLDRTEPPEVHAADIELLGTEARQLKAPVHPDWFKDAPGGGLAPALQVGELGWDWRDARFAFLETFRCLYPSPVFGAAWNQLTEMFP